MGEEKGEKAEWARAKKGRGGLRKMDVAHRQREREREKERERDHDWQRGSLPMPMADRVADCGRTLQPRDKIVRTFKVAAWQTWSMQPATLIRDLIISSTPMNLASSYLNFARLESL